MADPAPKARLDNDQRASEHLALRTFDQFCSAGRPMRPTEDHAGPALVEVSGIALLDAFVKQHPQFEASRKTILGRLPVRVRVHEEWWLNVRALAGEKQAG